MWKWTAEGVVKAKQHFEAALAHDPGFALACDGLANLSWHLRFWGFLPPDETDPMRMFYPLRASELDPRLAEARALFAFHPERYNYIDAYSYDWAETENQMAHAPELNPNSNDSGRNDFQKVLQLDVGHEGLEAGLQGPTCNEQHRRI